MGEVFTNPRYPPGKHVNYPLRLPSDVYAQVQAAARAADLSAAQWLRQAIRDKLARDNAE